MMELKKVVPRGRAFEEDVAMFALSGEDLRKTVLGFGDGAAGFNARMRALEETHRAGLVRGGYEFRKGVCEMLKIGR